MLPAPALGSPPDSDQVTFAGSPSASVAVRCVVRLVSMCVVAAWMDRLEAPFRSVAETRPPQPATAITAGTGSTANTNLSLRCKDKPQRQLVIPRALAHQEITLRKKLRVPNLPRTPRKKANASRIAHSGMWLTPGVTAARSPSLIYTIGLNRTTICNQGIAFNPSQG